MGGLYRNSAPTDNPEGDAAFNVAWGQEKRRLARDPRGLTCGSTPALLPRGGPTPRLLGSLGAFFGGLGGSSRGASCSGVRPSAAPSIGYGSRQRQLVIADQGEAPKLPVTRWRAYRFTGTAHLALLGGAGRTSTNEQITVAFSTRLSLGMPSPYPLDLPSNTSRYPK